MMRISKKGVFLIFILVVSSSIWASNAIASDACDCGDPPDGDDEGCCDGPEFSPLTAGVAFLGTLGLAALVRYKFSKST